MDWTKLTDDPINEDAREQVKKAILSKRKIIDDCSMMDYVVNRIKGKRVLDIGMVEHAENAFSRPSWRHEIIKTNASYCLGIDILERLVNKLKARGYNVQCVDATSDFDIGDRFDVVFIGDVIEHVDNAVNLLKFSKRHLTKDGVILTSTPNPFSRKFIRQVRKNDTAIVNLDHVAWITPTMALEIGRRAGLDLSHYYLIKKAPGGVFSRFIKSFARRFEPTELPYPDFLYEFSLRPEETA